MAAIGGSCFAVAGLLRPQTPSSRTLLTLRKSTAVAIDAQRKPYSIACAMTTTQGITRTHEYNHDYNNVNGEEVIADMVDEDVQEVKSNLRDYFELAKLFIRSDGGSAGPPRWFSPLESSRKMRDAPLLLYLPGLDGLGLGLVLQHQKLGKMFDIWCLHIPVKDRTPFQELVLLVEETVRSENRRSPDRPIYLVGESIGGCLALIVAARNPDIDLVLILANPATSYGKSQLPSLLSLLQVMPTKNSLISVPYTLNLMTGDPLSLVLSSVRNGLEWQATLKQLFQNFGELSSYISVIADILPRDTLLWKLQMMKSASLYANSRLHAVKAQILVLASGRDPLLPNLEEAERIRGALPKQEVRFLKKTGQMPKCDIRNLKDSGPFLFLEGDVDLVLIIKGTSFYRRAKCHDYISDYFPPTEVEFHKTSESFRWLNIASGPVMLSTLEDGTIVRGLAGIPAEGPVIFVGYHMLLGLEIYPLVINFMEERNILVRGLAHPMLFTKLQEDDMDLSMFDSYRIMGAVPVLASNFYKLLSSHSHVLLYPGGMREALHKKYQFEFIEPLLGGNENFEEEYIFGGDLALLWMLTLLGKSIWNAIHSQNSEEGEEYQLFWPERSEFVRMAARFGAKIIPFGVVGEDDIFQVFLDGDDQMKIPYLRESIEKRTKQIQLRTEMEGEVANQPAYFPGILPKPPGRFYYLFGKPIYTEEMKQELRDRDKAHEMYLQVKSEVEHCISYLKEKREKDPYRSLAARTLYQAMHGSIDDIPTFEL